MVNIVSDVNMNWHAPNPNINGTTCCSRLLRSNGSAGNDHKSRDRQMQKPAAMPTPTSAPPIMPVAPPFNAITNTTAMTSRANPLMIADQPSQKKSCRPCSTPENIGTNNDAKTTGNVTHKPAMPGSCQHSVILL